MPARHVAARFPTIKGSFNESAVSRPCTFAVRYGLGARFGRAGGATGRRTGGRVAASSGAVSPRRSSDSAALSRRSTLQNRAAWLAPLRPPAERLEPPPLRPGRAGLVLPVSVTHAETKSPGSCRGFFWFDFDPFSVRPRESRDPVLYLQERKNWIPAFAEMNGVWVCSQECRLRGHPFRPAYASIWLSPAYAGMGIGPMSLGTA